MATDLGFETHVRIGSSVATMTDVKVEPHVEFMLSEEFDKVVCGKTKATGYPRCRWTYPTMLLDGEQYYQLQALVANEASATVYLDIPTNEIDVTTYEPVIGTYQAIMNWPPEGVHRVRYNQWEFPDDGILFTNLEPT